MSTRITTRQRSTSRASSRLRRAAWCLLVAPALLAHAPFAHAPAEAAIRYRSQGERTLGGADALAGSRAACEVGAGRLWVEVDGVGECVAFHATAGLVGASIAIVFFEGDVPSTYHRDAERLRRHRASLHAALDNLARRHGIPHVFMARPGTFGSTGDHGARRSRREYLVLDAALTTLRTRHGIGRFVLTGQSGGATVVGALLTLGRTDVLCATPASGGYDLVGMLDWHAEKRGIDGRHREHPAVLAEMLSVIENVGGVAMDGKRRVFIVADPVDRVTPFVLQERFAQRLVAAGHHARVVKAVGTGRDRHGLGHVGLALAAMCAKGASDEEIEKAPTRGQLRPTPP